MKSGSEPKEVSGVSHGRPLFPPYPGPFDVPVLLDDRKSLDGFEMTRCTYFTIQATDRAVDDWVAELRRRELPFLLLGVTAVIHRPSLTQERFETPSDIDTLFDPIEELGGVVVETSHIWLPNYLLDRFEAVRGDVLRLDFGLFRIALLFQREAITMDRLLSVCDEAHRYSIVERSEDETRAFRLWSEEQFDQASANFQRQRADPELGVLDWRDADGVIHKA